MSLLDQHINEGKFSAFTNQLLAWARENYEKSWGAQVIIEATDKEDLRATFNSYLEEGITDPEEMFVLELQIASARDSQYQDAQDPGQGFAAWGEY